MADGLLTRREVADTIFHGNATLAYNQDRVDPFWQRFPRQARAILQILVAKGDAVQVAESASALKPTDKVRTFLTNAMVNKLYSSLLHPPLSYKGPQFQHRAADGSNNNFLFPELGKAGLPYAKSVPGKQPMQGARPDPGDLFDLLMAREDPDSIKEGDLGISSLLLYHADLIIHDIFRTNNSDRNISDASSYLDLSPLYGRDRARQEAVRTMKDGLLKPDTFAEDRLLNQPPGVCIYIIMYNRFHNYVAKQLKEINENGKFTMTETRPEGWLPSQAVLDDILEKYAEKVTGKSRKHTISPSDWPRPKGWNPPPAIRDVILREFRSKAWEDAKAASPGLHPDDWDWEAPADLDAKLAKRYDEEWTKLMVQSTKADAFPSGWMPDQSEIKEELDEAWKNTAATKFDEDLFQTARLITCGMYIQISVHDYLRTLMRRHPVNTSWTLDPRLEMSIVNKETVSRGFGNQVTVEFNVMYRFHSPLSRRDEGWSRRFIQDGVKKMQSKGMLLEGALTPKDFESASIPVQIMKKMISGLNTRGPTTDQRSEAPWSPKTLRPERLLPDGKTWEFYDLKRDPVTGKFRDEDLVHEIVQSMQDPICQFGARNTPKFFRSIEILGIMQARSWEVSSLNEFREFFGLRRHATFEDINNDPKVVRSLRNLYEHPDMVELYPGIFCEGDGRCLDPGSSCPDGAGTALWRAVFSDAVTLVRSDRFYTLDWNTDTLTAWGMAEVTPDLNVFKGGVMARLFQRAFPGFFKADSIHLWNPFHTPAMNAVFAHQQGLLSTLEPISNLGVPEKDFEKIMGLRRNLYYQSENSIRGYLERQGLKHYADGLDKHDFIDLDSTRQKLRGAYRALPFFKRLMHDGGTDADKFVNKLKFKLLRNKVKMPPPKREPEPIAVSNYDTIRNTFLDKSKLHLFKNPGYTDESAIPEGPLREVLCERDSLRKICSEVLLEKATKETQAMFLSYFLSMAHEIRHREQLNLQKIDPKDPKAETHDHVKQIDIVRDYAIPVITRFVADVLGFGHLVRTREQLHRPWGENEIFEHMTNCQDWVTFNSDETRSYRRREKFRESIKMLMKLTEDGVADAQKVPFDSWRHNYHLVHGDSKHVEGLRRFGVELTQAVTAKMKERRDVKKPLEATAAVLLAFALDASHKSVAMFTEVMQSLLRGYPVEKDGKPVKVRKDWEQISVLATSGDPKSMEKITHYILEAQRKEFDIPLIRKYVQPSSSTSGHANGSAHGLTNGTTNGSANGAANGKTVASAEPFYLTVEDEQAGRLHTPRDGQVYLLEIRKASTAGEATDAPLDLARSPADYLVYGRRADGALDAKQLTLLALTGLVAHAAQLCELREAHDTKGQIKTALVPAVADESGEGDVRDAYRKRYLTTRWDQLVSYPETWNLRFNGLGEGVAPGRDKSWQGHGQAEEGCAGCVS